MGKKAAKRFEKIEYDVMGDEFIKTLTQVKNTLSRLPEARNETIGS